MYTYFVNIFEFFWRCLCGSRFQEEEHKVSSELYSRQRERIVELSAHLIAIVSCFFFRSVVSISLNCIRLRFRVLFCLFLVYQFNTHSFPNHISFSFGDPFSLIVPLWHALTLYHGLKLIMQFYLGHSKYCLNFALVRDIPLCTRQSNTKKPFIMSNRRLKYLSASSDLGSGIAVWEYFKQARVRQNIHET